MGGVKKGGARVEKRYEWVASRFSSANDSEPQSEIVSLVETPDPAYAGKSNAARYEWREAMSFSILPSG